MVILKLIQGKARGENCWVWAEGRGLEEGKCSSWRSQGTAPSQVHQQEQKGFH